MEGMRDVALAHYETLPDDKKTKIQSDFQRTVEERSVSEYFEQFKIGYNSEIVEKCLTSCEEYEEGRFDFNNFITLRYILKNLQVGKCDECSSLILGKPFFSCYECFMDSDVPSYDLCCDCYGSKKFQGHQHVKFYDSQTLCYLSRRIPARKKGDQEEVMEKMFIDFACHLMKKVRSKKTEKRRTIVDHQVLNFDNNKKLEEIYRLAKELMENSNGREETVEEISTTYSRPVRHSVDLLGAKPSHAAQAPRKARAGGVTE